MVDINKVLDSEQEKEHKLVVYTSQYRYSGERRLDITARNGSDLFRPSWEEVAKFKYGKQDAKAREEYETYYHAAMLESYKNYKNGWERLLEADWVVLVCYCKADTFCHRYLLADYLVKLGAVYKGEIPNV